MSKWPCVPENLCAILPKNLPTFLQTGATRTLGRAVSLIDPKNKTRADAVNRFDEYQDFCIYLRGGSKLNNFHVIADKICNQCDYLVADEIIKSHRDPTNNDLFVTRYRCYLGLEELATTINVGGHKVMVVSGQFLPQEGIDDIINSLACLGNNKPAKSDVSSDLWESINKYRYPEDLWKNADIKENEWDNKTDVSEFSALKLQQELEQLAFKLAGSSLSAPAQRANDFVEGKFSQTLPKTSYIPGITSSRLDEELPPFIVKKLKKALKEFSRRMRGYLSDEAILVGVESRTSSPIRVPRDRESFMHVEVNGLFPCGEGAGYAGGIVSSALDGGNCAEAVGKFLK